jgi:predicted aspartyl protease
MALRRAVHGTLLVGVALLVGLGACQTARAEFYKYIDRSGKSVFVDDLGKVPPEYRDQFRIYRERYDGLSEEARVQELERENRRIAAIESERSQREFDHQRERFDRLLQEESERRSQENGRRETRVTLDGDRVLVPVTLGYEQREIQAMLLLDTGASMTTLHQEVAEKLGIRQARKVRAQVVGGKFIDFDLVRLDYIRVGPYDLKGAHAGVIDHRGPEVTHQGLLGMNFLRNLRYSVDFDKRVIRWNP